MKEKMKYMYFSDGTDNGKPFDSLEEAVKYLYQQALHSKVHLDGVLKDMQVTEDAFVLYVEKYHFLRGRAIEEMGIRIRTACDAEKIKSYFEINRI